MNTDRGLATAFLAEGESSHSQFDKSQLQTPFALGMQAFMSLQHFPASHGICCLLYVGLCM